MAHKSIVRSYGMVMYVFCDGSSTGSPGPYSDINVDINRIGLWIGLSSVDRGWLLFPFGASFWLPTSSLTLRSIPSSSGSAPTTRHTFHWFLGKSSSLTMTTSSSRRFFLGRAHFWLSYNERRNSFLHLHLNSLVRCCTCLHHFLE